MEAKATSTTWDHLFLFGTVPTPRMLDKVRLAIREGSRVALVYCSRSHELVAIEPIEGCDVFVRRVPYRGVDLRRVFSTFGMIGWLRTNIFRHTARNCRVHTDCLDMLAAAQIASYGKAAAFHHQVRDLHNLQLGSGPLCWAVRGGERILLRRISMLMLTCEGYYEAYYSRFYRGNHVVVENWPDLHVWQDFQRRRSDEFVIGFIGVVRYLDCLMALVEAIDILRGEGYPIRLKIAGGGDADVLIQAVGERDWIDVHGPFSYRDRIKDLYADVDVIWSVYDTRFKNVRVAMPNKFYESILSGIPIVVAQGTYLEERVQQERIGTSVPGTDAAAIADKLHEACLGSGWYAAAQTALAQKNPVEYLRNEHPRRIRVAVLGPDASHDLRTIAEPHSTSHRDSDKSADAA